MKVLPVTVSTTTAVPRVANKVVSKALKSNSKLDGDKCSFKY